MRAGRSRSQWRRRWERGGTSILQQAQGRLNLPPRKQGCVGRGRLRLDGLAGARFAEQGGVGWMSSGASAEQWRVGWMSSGASAEQWRVLVCEQWRVGQGRLRLDGLAAANPSFPRTRESTSPATGFRLGGRNDDGKGRRAGGGCRIRAGRPRSQIPSRWRSGSRASAPSRG